MGDFDPIQLQGEWANDQTRHLAFMQENYFTVRLSHCIGPNQFKRIEEFFKSRDAALDYRDAYVRDNDKAAGRVYKIRASGRLGSIVGR